MLIKKALLNRKYVKKDFQMTTSGSYTQIEGQQLSEKKQVPLKFKPFKENEVTSYLEDFQAYCQTEKIYLKITFPDTVKFQSYTNEPFLQQLYLYLTNYFEVLGQPEDFMYDVSYFYNSVYHVNAMGQKIRTNYLVDRLKEEKI